MNDDFLHRIRAEPPASFMASLKARLDRQLPPATAPRRSLFRVLAFGLLFGGSVFAISLLTVNGIPEGARNLIWTHHPDPAATGTTGHSSDAPTRVPHISHSTPSGGGRPGGGRPGIDSPGDAGKGPDRPRSMGASAPTNSSAPVAQSVNGVASAGNRTDINIVMPKALEAYATYLNEGSRRIKDPTLSITATDTTTEALAQLCGDAGSGKGARTPDMAGATRRITHAEFDTCSRNVGNLAELQMGQQAIVLARSKLYGALALAPRDIFFALAAEIPSPTRPEEFIRNPNNSWKQVNGALDEAPIEVLAPPLSSSTGIAFRELLFEAGCNTVPTIVALKQTDPARYERVCKTLRKDASYIELPDTPNDVLQRLQVTPNAIGIVSFRLFPGNSDIFVAGPISGIEPTRETISAGSYPGSRILYLYVNQKRVYARSPYFVANFLNTFDYLPGTFAVIPLDAAGIKAITQNPARLADLKL
jgi:phosphate transport system substrate-binding protein